MSTLPPIPGDDDHFVLIDLSGASTPPARMECQAPDDAPCRTLVPDFIPASLRDSVLSRGSCYYEVWFNHLGSTVQGEILVGVDGLWAGTEGFTFRATHAEVVPEEG